MEVDDSLQPNKDDSQIPTPTPIEDLPLEERIKLAEKYSPFEGIQPGWLIDAKDTVSAWCIAKVLKITNGEILITFDGWSHKYDLVLSYV